MFVNLTNRKTQLSGFGLITDFWNLLKYYFPGEAFDETVILLTDRCNANSGTGCRVWREFYPNTCYWTGDVSDILETYINLVNENKIPEYDRDNNPSAIANIENAVFKATGMTNPDKVKKVLYELYYATLDKTITSIAILKPRTWYEGTKYRQGLPDYIPSAGNLVSNTASSIGNSLLSVGKYLLIAGAVVGGVYVFKNAASIKAGIKGIVGKKETA